MPEYRKDGGRAVDFKGACDVFGEAGRAMSRLNRSGVAPI